MKKKYYAVVKGLTPGVYSNWEDCQIQVIGCPGAIYKSFSSKKAAQEYVEKGLTPFDNIIEKAEPNRLVKPNDTSEKIVAYVDGSFNIETNCYGSGVYLEINGEEVELMRSGQDVKMAKMKNVAGEIEAACLAIEYCMTLGIKSLEIIHDYQGISSWPLGQWKTNKPETERYAKYVKDAMKTMQITFRKVKGHAGVYGNERADQLAKSSVGIK